MSRYYQFERGTYKAEHTDHSEEIAVLRAEALRRVRAISPDDASNDDAVLNAAFMTAAELLQSHDDTGISLDNWTGPLELVEACLLEVGYPDGTFLPNGV